MQYSRKSCLRSPRAACCPARSAIWPIALLVIQLCAIEAAAQQPTFSSSAPANATHAAALAGNISATFSQAIASGTVSNSSFVVHGGFVGRHATGGTASTHRDGTYSGQGTATLTFDPGQNFKPGEKVYVTLTTGLQNSSAQGLSAARVYQFRAAAAAGPVVFTHSSHDLDTSTNSTRDVVLGDLDADGDLDLIIGNSGQADRIYLSNGNGTFATGNDLDASANMTFAMALGDLDADGDLDLITVTSSALQTNRIYLSNGNGTFTTGNNVDASTIATAAVALGDLDGDGDLDLAVGNDGQVNKIYLGNGDGTFAAGTNLDTPTNSTYALSPGDLDGDGDLDLVIGNYGQVNRVNLNNGNGTFAAGNDIDTPTKFTGDAPLGDLDGDGDLDFIAANGATADRVYLGHGDGTFATGNDIDTPATFTNEAALGDLDGDGDLDLIAGGAGQTNKIYLSNGNGTFAAGNDADASTNSTLAIALGDLDGDGDLDLVTGNNTQVNRVYLNSGNKDGTLTASATLDEGNAIALSSTATTAGTAIDLFDFTLADGGSGDGLALKVSQVAINTSGTGPFAKITWLLNGPDANNISGAYSSATNKITFSGLSLSIADGGNETYTLRGYYNTITGLTEGATFSFSLDGDTNVAATAGSSMSGNNAAIANAAAAVVRAAPRVSRNLGARTVEGGSVTLSADLLQYTDVLSGAAQIVYAIGAVPTAGQLAKSGTALGVGSTFTQDDIGQGRVLYTHDGSEIFADGFSFTVSGSAGAATGSASFSFAIDAANDDPFTDVLQTVSLDEGGQATITNGSLRLLDGDTLPQDIVYTIASPPAHGRLSLSRFTQRDIDERLLAYRHDGGESTSDEFSFTVDDGQGGGIGLQTLRLLINPINDAPVAPVVDAPHIAEGQWLVLDLAATDPEGAVVEWTVSGLPEGAIFEGTTLKWLPTYAQAGTYPLAVVYDDGQGGTSRLRFDIAVADAAVPTPLPDPLRVNFGDVVSGQTAETSFTLHNTSPFPLQLNEFTSSADAFAVVRPVSPVQLAPNARTECIVRFSARADVAEVQQAMLTAMTDLGPIEVSATGRSLWRGLEPAADLLEFGARTIGSTPRQRLELSNPGNQPLTIRAQLPTAGPFRVEPSTLTLTGGEHGDLNIYFNPRDAGLAEQTLQLHDSAGGLSRAVVLRGRGRIPGEGRAAIDFNLAPGNQQQRRIGGAVPGDIIELQLHVRGARQLAGWSARLDYDPRTLSYIADSFVPGALLPRLTQLEQLGAGYVEVGGDVLGLAAPATGSGTLGTLSFRVEEGFADRTELAITQLAWHRAGESGSARDIVYAPATIERAAIATVEPGDFDADGRIDLDDFFLFAEQFERRVPPAPPRFDLDDDGRVHFGDFFLFADRFAASGAPASKLHALATDLLGLPAQSALQPNFPNPFNAETTLPYVVASAGPVQLAIYDATGQRVRLLFDSFRATGTYRATWDGQDDQGRTVGSGLYLSRLTVGAQVLHRKLLLVH